MTFGKTVDEMITALPRKEQIIVNSLRSLIMECLPMATEKGYYGQGVPFYRHHRMICFIFPGAVPWGLKRTEASEKHRGVALGFCQGHLMANEDGSLLAEGRKMAHAIYYHSIDEIDENQVRAWLYEAEIIDKMLGKSKVRVAKK